jgi:hypothetical protein
MEVLCARALHTPLLQANPQVAMVSAWEQPLVFRPQAFFRRYRRGFDLPNMLNVIGRIARRRFDPESQI